MKYDFLTVLNSIYKKEKLDNLEMDTSMCFALNKCLSYNKANMSILNKLSKLLFFVEPLHYYYLLFTHVTPNYKAFFKGYKKEKMKENKLIDKAKYVLGWSSKEYEANKIMLEKSLEENNKYWKEKLGVK